MTRILKTITAWQTISNHIAPHSQIGLVPTMGKLHDGHESLLNRSVRENDLTVLSIFVNPTQFDDKRDFTSYPQSLTQDIKIAQKVGTDYVLHLKYKALYPDDYHFQVHEIAINQLMEGKARTGHFSGVLTILLKLLNLIKPTRLYLGEKDYQQLQLIRGMVDAFFLETEIISCPTIRNQAGLALSSRNALLSKSQHQLASQFYQCLSTIAPKGAVSDKLKSLGFEVDYIEEHWGRRFGAVRLGKVRLIDNIEIPEKSYPEYFMSDRGEKQRNL